MAPGPFFIIWGLALPYIIWEAWGSASPLLAAGLFAGGLLGWTLFEYAMHRFLFHLELDWRPVQWLVFLIHGNHHDHPNDRLRNLMPPVVSLPIAAAIWSGCVAMTGPAGSWLFLGFIVGYVGYDVIHFACHQWPMQGPLGRMLKRHHMRHHHVDENGNYAISAIFWDRFFGSKITSLRR